MMPAIIGEGDELRNPVEGFGGNRDVSLPRHQERSDLRGAALMQHELHAGKLLLEFRNDGRQRITRLGVGRGQCQPADVLPAEMRRDVSDVLEVDKDTFDQWRKLLAGLRQPDNAFAVPDEDADPKLMLEIHDVLADAGLRGVECLRNLGQIEVAVKRFTQNSNLLQVHLFRIRPNVG